MVRHNRQNKKYDGPVRSERLELRKRLSTMPTKRVRSRGTASQGRASCFASNAKQNSRTAYSSCKEKPSYNLNSTSMVKIGSLFEKYRTRLRPPQGVVVTAFCAVVESELDIRLPPSSVRYNVHTRTIGVTAGGPQKTEILLNQKHILDLCRETLGDLGAPQHIV